MELLVCPKCKVEFKLENPTRNGEEIVGGHLKCVGCGESFSIVKGIPRITLQNIEEVIGYNLNFQHYWLNMDWPRPEMTKERFFYLNDWKPQDIQNKLVLDVASGGGRWTYQFANEGAGEIVALDCSSSSIERSAEICSKFKNVNYVQADVFNMPFRDNVFDIVHSHGALHHTPNTGKAVQECAKKVKVGGELVFLIFRNLTGVQQVIDDILCGVVKRLPLKVSYYLTLLPTLLEYIPGSVFLLENIFHLSGQPDFTLKHLHNFDWYTSKYRDRVSPNTAKQWLADGNYDVRILDTNNIRVDSSYSSIKKLKEFLLEKGFYLKGTLGVKARKLR